ncbi:Asparaginase OS=Bosea thiooxidans OX=53254 GN=ARD30_23635 PE=4 SV=1 [Bosea thiooxidans]
MENPVLAEVTRGNVVKSRHRGAAIVVDADGAVVFATGDIERAVFPRSAVKALQALPLLESGAADRYGLTEAEIALAVSSHSGEPLHAETSLAMLRKAGREAACLECGAHWPSRRGRGAGARSLRSRAERLDERFLGKHAGFVCLSCALDEDPAGYVKAGHPVQQAVRGALDGDRRGPRGGADGHRWLLDPHLCRAAFGAGARLRALRHRPRLGPERAKAAARIRAAAAAHPFMVAGTGRFDTRLMGLLGARAFTKTGAEGVYCAALPELGYGIALKCDDGAGRASEVALGALIARFLPMDEATQAAPGPRCGRRC